MNKKKRVIKHSVDDTISMMYFAKKGIGVYKNSICPKLIDEASKCEQRKYLKLIMRRQNDK